MNSTRWLLSVTGRFLLGCITYWFLLTSAAAQCYQVTAEGPESIQVKFEFLTPTKISPPGQQQLTTTPRIKSTLTMGGKSYTSEAGGMVVSPIGGIVSSVVGTTDSGATGWGVSLLTYSRYWNTGSDLPKSLPAVAQWEDAYISIFLPNDKVQGYKISDIQPCGSSGKIFFYIAYLSEEHDKTCKDSYKHKLPCYQSFVDAAETWRKDVEARPAFKPGADLFIRADVRKVGDFVDAWQHILAEAKQRNMEVQAGALFTHSSYLGSLIGSDTGLEFADGPGDPNKTLDKEALRALPVLPWSRPSGVLELHGCNSGVMRGITLWAPAQLLAHTQSVTTIGEAGWSYFSKYPEVFYPIDRTSTRVYLHAYPTGRNTGVSITGGNRLTPFVFHPD